MTMSSLQLMPSLLRGQARHDYIRTKSNNLTTCCSRLYYSRLSNRQSHLHDRNNLLVRNCYKMLSALGTQQGPVCFLRTSSNGKNNNKWKPPNLLKKMPPLKIGAVSSFALLSLSKSKSIFAALKLTKFASLGSMLVSVGAYSTVYGIPYAAGMVGLILVHESGHALTMRHLGVPFSPMIFVPFMGAAVAMKRPAKDAYEEALIALGGPVLGTIGSLAVWGVGLGTGSQLCLALADFGFMINLFNLIPIGMLDGGRIGNALSPYAGVAGVGIASSMILSGYVDNPIFYVITLAGGYQTGMRLYNQYQGIPHGDASLSRYYYNISNQQKLKIGAGYFGLLGVLFGSMGVNEALKKSPQRLRYEKQTASSSSEGDGLKNFYKDF